MSEQDLIKKAQEGDVEAFEQLIRDYEKRILNYCFRMMGNLSDAEDAAQEVFVKIFRFIDSFNGQSSFSTWLYRIASNVCLDLLRKAKRQPKDTVSIYQENDEGEEYSIAIEDTEPDPYERAQLSEAQKVLKEALNQLSDEHKQVIILRDIEGLSYEEIAEAMGTAPGTVKSRINRARQMLKKLLEKDKELFLLS
ncbi:MAG: sigma-70 family RNA polymerase sigma factor [Ruminococcaceae bacterium]|nr:sigma-70 family RNA polymerase sigma factor [Oscillospiraceae bacterium]